MYGGAKMDAITYKNILTKFGTMKQFSKVSGFSEPSLSRMLNKKAKTRFKTIMKFKELGVYNNTFLPPVSNF